MKLSDAITDHYLFPAALVLVCCAVFLLGQRHIGPAQRWLPLWHLLPRGRRSSASKTPPRSLSPEKKVPNNAPSQVDYKDVFPPPSRDTLSAVLEGLPAEKRDQFWRGDIPEEEFKKGQIGLETDFRTCGPSTYTSMGWSLGEIEALGDFPDYAALSDVPLPQAYRECDVDRAIPRPYRPFRWAYHQTMSLTKLEPEWWLELEKSYKTRIKERKELVARHGEMVLNYRSGSELASKELMEMVLQFYCARYPQYFSLTYSPDRGYIFRNGILETETVIKNMHPLHVLLENVPEDFAVMLRNPDDGQYYLRGGVLCSALGWNIGTKIGMALKEIHQPIPDYKEKMEFSMDRYFSKMPTSRPIQRGSWGLEVDKPLFMPPDDPHEKYRDWQAPDVTLERVHLRVDWQTLRRLPLSGAIIFNFKALFTPLTQFREEPYIPSICLKVLKEGKKNIMEYKNTWHTEHVAVPKLEEYIREQEEKGMIEKDWQVKTLDEAPYFPGWQEQWMSKQGF